MSSSHLFHSWPSELETVYYNLLEWACKHRHGATDKQSYAVFVVE